MRLIYILFSFFVIISSLVATSYFVNKDRLQTWLAKPKPPGQTVLINGLSTYYIPFQTENTHTHQETVIVVLTGLGYSIVEYTPLAKALSEHAQVLMMDRPGYSWSKSLLKPSQEELISHISSAIQTLAPNKKILYVGFSIGSFFATELINRSPEAAIGLVAITPLPKPTSAISRKLDEDTHHVFIDQTNALDRAVVAAKLGFFRFVNMTPHEVPKEIHEDVLNNQASQYTAIAARDEYSYFVQSQPRQIPIKTIVLRNNSKLHVELLKKYELSDTVVADVEAVWRDSAEQFAAQAKSSKIIESSAGIFDLHLENINDIKSAVAEILSDQK